ncbi:MAG: inositol monophosphatase [Candidatus Aenigmarchaeota archaeon]|nr:inositol monophosphatase [Candidatus Aenigmarchaeota archaeon]MDW8148994.1 inositol monophosphatase [Candidatus Aenigmarchaeota archaeon]
MKKLLFSTVKKVGKALKEMFYNREGLEKVKIKDGRNFSIRADIVAEEIYLSQLSNQDVKIISEEIGVVGKGEDIIIIDPLDGTINFFRNIPIFCTQLAFISRENTISIIFNPISKELFYSIKGESFLNKKKILVSKETNLSKCIIDFGSKAILDKKLMNIKCFSKRCLASAGISFAYVASSKINSSIMKECFIWDYYPGKILIENAGGIMLEFNGNYRFNLEIKNLVAGNKTIVKKILHNVNKRD